jgi:hypothetical protein
VSLAECDPDQDRPPRGMVSAQGEGDLADLGRVGLGQMSGRVIVGSETVGPALAEALEQMAHGAWGESEGGGEAGGGLALLGTLEQLPPDRDWDGPWHRRILPRVGSTVVGYSY